MQPWIAGFLVTLALLTSEAGLAQKNNSDNPVLRLSYTCSYGMDCGQDEASPKVCLATYRRGYYQLSRMTKDGMQTLQGTMSRIQMLHLNGLLKNLDFQSANEGIVRTGSEFLIVQFVREGEARNHAWVDPDHEHPFPAPVAMVVDWLRSFKPEDSHPLTLHELSDQRICPAMKLNPMPAQGI